jgi:hypothetical protein
MRWNNSKEKKIKIFSIDAETNGLYGQAFSIAAVVTDDSREIARYTGRCPINGQIDDFVAKEILPNMKDIPENVKDYNDLLEDFWKFYSKHKKGAEIIAHVPCPVESKILRDMVEKDLTNRIGEGPFPLIDTSSILRSRKENPTDLEAYVKKHKLKISFEGKVHNPLYDAIVAETIYRHLITN